MTNEKEWKPAPEDPNQWINDYAFEATVEDVEGDEYHIQAVELQNVHKIAREAEQRGRVAALEKLAQLVSAMTTKPIEGIPEDATHEDYFDKGYMVGVNVACMYTLKDIATLQAQEGQSPSHETKHGLGGAAGLTPDDIKLFKA